MGGIWAALFAIAFIAGSASLRAENASQGSEKISGYAMVLSPSTLSMNGKQIELWGMMALADDQQCLKDDRPWQCGEQAEMALKHLAEGLPLTCAVMGVAENGSILGQCSESGGGKPHDLARHLIRHGWALSAIGESGKSYVQDEADAKRKRRGIWSGKFQSTKNWKEGVQEYMNDEE